MIHIRVVFHAMFFNKNGFYKFIMFIEFMHQSMTSSKSQTCILLFWKYWVFFSKQTMPKMVSKVEMKYYEFLTRTVTGKMKRSWL